MEHVGIDLGSRRSHLVVLDSKGLELSREVVDTPRLSDWLARRAPSRVVMEACTQSPSVGQSARNAKHETFVVPGNVVRALGVGARGIKNDFRDAEVLAQSSVRIENLPSVHVRSDGSTQMQGLLLARAQLIKARKGLALSIKTWLRGSLITLHGRANSKNFTDVVRQLATDRPDGMPSWVEALLTSFDFLTDQLAILNEQVAQMADTDDVCKLLMTAPGIGPVVALSFRAQIDDANRFASADELASYLALAPGEATTGGKLKRTGTIKAGPTRLKALLVQAAWSYYQHRQGEPAGAWVRRLEERRGKKVAIVALARKLATVMWAMWKHDKPYNPSRAAARAAKVPVSSSLAE